MQAVLPSLLATSSLQVGGEELLLFLAVMASWAGVPAIGTLALTAAAVAASQGQMNLAVVIIISTVAGEIGGLIGYAIGSHWGRELVERPGKHRDRRQRMLASGEHAYARWGRLAVFFTPAIISGAAKMKYLQFVVWNLLASFGFSLSVAASAYGLGRIATGNHSWRDIAILAVGLAAGAAIAIHQRHRRDRTRPAAPGASS